MKITLSSSQNFGEQLYKYTVWKLNPMPFVVMVGQDEASYVAHPDFKGAIVCFRVHGNEIKRHVGEFIGFTAAELAEPMDMWILDEQRLPQHLDTLEKVLRSAVSEHEMLPGSMLHGPDYIISILKNLQSKGKEKVA